ncbi:MAG TPA: N-acetyltransferase [Jatrophihabitans sp.]|jgi:putative acetyltransferase
MTAVRPARASDAAAIRDVTTRAFADAHVAALVDTLAAGPARVSLVAETDGAVVGHTMLSRGWVDAERELVEVLVLSPLSVEPAHQRGGIGSELVRAALTAAEQANAPAVFLEGARQYYARFGFEPGEARGFTAPSPRIPGSAFQVVVLPAWQDWMTGALVYPDAFWAHDLVGLRGERLAQVRAAE